VDHGLRRTGVGDEERRRQAAFGRLGSLGHPRSLDVAADAIDREL
jgi:hypothetical protein